MCIGRTNERKKKHIEEEKKRYTLFPGSMHKLYTGTKRVAHTRQWLWQPLLQRQHGRRSDSIPEHRADLLLTRSKP